MVVKPPEFFIIKQPRAGMPNITYIRNKLIRHNVMWVQIHVSGAATMRRNKIYILCTLCRKSSIFNLNTNVSKIHTYLRSLSIGIRIFTVIALVCFHERASRDVKYSRFYTLDSRSSAIRKADIKSTLTKWWQVFFMSNHYESIESVSLNTISIY